ncbi:MAG TPA: RHS repeat-associated core domain-containing protein [Candidatus Saccharimonadales bacterium]|nr:RHS repeat-associated core domain-containing protein [Candidatus Saccharimonadales bacterium]
MKKFRKFITRTVLASMAALFMVALYGPTVYAASCGPLAYGFPSYPYYGQSSYYSYFNYLPRVGGVSLDLAATFLANMSDVTGAYYDQATNRIVLVGPHNSSPTPVFNKDDLAVAVRSVIFNNTLPSVNIQAPVSGRASVDYGGPIANTNFGSVLEQADYKLKQTTIGRTSSGQTVTSVVPSFKSVIDRYLQYGITTGSSVSRFWISPQAMVLKKDDATNSFVFDQATMQVQTQPLSTSNSANWNRAATDFVNDLTANYTNYAQETPALAQTKELGKIVSVVKWLKDNNVATDYSWAQNYTPTSVATPTSVPASTRSDTQGNLTMTSTGGVDYSTPNTYASANGTATTLKTTAQSAAPSPDSNHWTFTQSGQQYDTVAVAANAFRSVGSYSTNVTDYSVKTQGDLSLDFKRVYSSLTTSQNGIGHGWAFQPAGLSDNQPWNDVTCSPAGGYSGLYPHQITFQTLEGDYETFTYNCTTGYQADQPSYHTQIIRNSDGSFTAQLKDQTSFKFSSNLVLLMKKDKSNDGVYYQYDGTTHITRIQDDPGHTLTLNWNSQSQITSLTDWAGRTISYGYDSSGNLTSVTDARNNTLHYGYDGNNRLATMTDRQNKQLLAQSYNDQGKVVSSTDSSNLITNYSYDETNRVVTAKDINGRTNKKYYDSQGRTTQVVDPYLNSITYTYGSEIFPLTIKDKNNNTATYTYDNNGNNTSMKYPDNKQITYQYNAKNQVTQISDQRYDVNPKVTNFTYDSTGNLLTKNVAGISTTYTYDSAGQVISDTDALQHGTTYTRGAFGRILTTTDPSAGITTNTYDNLGRLTKQNDPSGKVASFTYDNDDNVVTATKDSSTTTNAYSAENKLISTITPDNKTTQYTYDTASNQTSTSDAVNSLTSYGYDQYEKMTSRQDALNHTTQYAYDNLGRKTQETTPLGKVAKWQYDANGNITKRTDESNRDTTYTYDNLNQLSQITYPNNTTINYSYDGRGNLTQATGARGTSNFTYDIYDRLTSEKDPNNALVNYTYDKANNMSTVTYPDNKIATYKYDASNRLKSATDWNGSKTYYNYNPNGNLQSKLLPNGINEDLSYDNSNRLSAVQYSKNQQLITGFSYTRDLRNNVTSEVESKPSALNQYTIYDEGLHSGWSTGWSWDSTVTTTDASNPYSGTKDIKWKVNAGGAGLHIRSTAGLIDTTPYSTITFAMKSTQANQAVVINMKDANDNDLSSPVDIGQYGYPTSTGYTVYTVPLSSLNAAGKQISGLTIEDSSGTSQPNMYIDAIKLSTATASPITIYDETVAPNFEIWKWSDTINTADTSQPFHGSKDLALTATAGYSGVQFNNSTGFSTKGYKYLRFALKGSKPGQDYTVQMTNSSGNGLAPELDIAKYAGRADASDYTIYTIPLADMGALNIKTFGYILQNQNGTIQPTVLLDNLTLVPSISTNTINSTSTFTYDSLNRILSATYPYGTYSYAYDAVGNRLTSNENNSTNTYSVNNDNQVTTKGTRGFSYDNQGNRTTDGSKSMTYDFDNRLSTFTDPGTGTSSTYTYDSLGHRIGTTSGTTTYQYVNETNSKIDDVLTQKNLSTSTQTYYLYGAGLISQGDTSSSSRQYSLDDGLGNVRYTTNNIGTTLHAYTYDPYGNVVSGSGSNYSFQEQQQNSQNNLYYLRARYYDPTTGSFTSRDPQSGNLADTQTQNGYSYANDNPINMTDPSGQNAFSDFFSGIGQSISNFFNSSGSLCTPRTTVPGLGSLRAGSSAAQARAVAENMGINIPSNYVATRADNNSGWVFRPPGSSGNANIIRVGEPDGANPTGYIRVYNSNGQPVTSEGLPGPNADTHLPISDEDIFDFPEFPL